ncbi:MAG: OadG family protein [Thermoanaerobacterales bacterium]|nr:OadG family protein [Thermoanaerobacterales bacterium]
MNNTETVFIQSLKTALMGMGIVLITLYILSLLLDLMKTIFYPKASHKKQEPIKQDIQKDTPIQLTKATTTEDSTQLIAAITGALSCYLNQPISQLKISSIRQIHKTTPAWGMAARLEKTRLSS